MATATPLGPPGAQTAQKQHAGLPELDAQPSAASIRLPEGAAQKVPASVRRAYIPGTCAASGPEPGTWKDQGLRTGLPARQWRLRDARGLSRLNYFLALWSQAHLPACNRQVTSTSIDIAQPGRLALPRRHVPL
jgi:hypothetical protein